MGDGRDGLDPVASDGQRDDGHHLAMEASEEELLRLCLLIRPGEPLSGWVGVAGEPTVAFGGWIELMAALSRLRGEHALWSLRQATADAPGPHPSRHRDGHRGA